MASMYELLSLSEEARADPATTMALMPRFAEFADKEQQQLIENFRPLRTQVLREAIERIISSLDTWRCSRDFSTDGAKRLQTLLQEVDYSAILKWYQYDHDVPRKLRFLMSLGLCIQAVFSRGMTPACQSLAVRLVRTYYTVSGNNVLDKWIAARLERCTQVWIRGAKLAWEERPCEMRDSLARSFQQVESWPTSLTQGQSHGWAHLHMPLEETHPLFAAFCACLKAYLPDLLRFCRKQSVEHCVQWSVFLIELLQPKKAGNGPEFEIDANAKIARLKPTSPVAPVPDIPAPVHEKPSVSVDTSAVAKFKLLVERMPVNDTPLPPPPPHFPEQVPCNVVSQPDMVPPVTKIAPVQKGGPWFCEETEKKRPTLPVDARERRKIDWTDKGFLLALINAGLEGDAAWSSQWQEFASVRRVPTSPPTSATPRGILQEFVEQNLYHARQQKWADFLLYHGPETELPWKRVDDVIVNDESVAASSSAPPPPPPEPVPVPDVEIPVPTRHDDERASVSSASSRKRRRKEKKERKARERDRDRSRSREKSQARQERERAAEHREEKEEKEREKNKRKGKARKLNMIGFSDAEESDGEIGGLGPTDEPSLYHRTQMCPLLQQCPRKKVCIFAHWESELRAIGEAKRIYDSKMRRNGMDAQSVKNAKLKEMKQNPLYKTATCPYVGPGRQCHFGSNCFYAHSPAELRVPPNADRIPVPAPLPGPMPPNNVTLAHNMMMNQIMNPMMSLMTPQLMMTMNMMHQQQQFQGEMPQGAAPVQAQPPRRKKKIREDDL